MAMAIQEIAASAAISTTPTYLGMVSLTPAAVAAQVEVRNGGVAGTVVCTIKAVAAGDTVAVDFPDGTLLPSGCYLTLAGAGALASIAFLPKA